MIKSLTEIVVQWGWRCFGMAHMGDTRIRALRFAEEAIELAQACNVSEEKMQLLVATVYSRPRGEGTQEVGGCMVTLTVLCRAMNIDLEKAFFTEVCRCLTKTPEHFAKRNEEKLRLGLD